MISQVGMFWNSKEAIRLLRFVNKTSDNHALALLSICYLPGVLAAYIQVRNVYVKTFSPLASS